MSTATFPAYLLDIAESETSIVILVNKALLSDKKVKRALKLLRELKAATLPAELPPIDDSHIPEMSDEEQAEIEAKLDAMTEEDKKIAYTSIIEIEL